jgi:hypothetical protein
MEIPPNLINEIRQGNVILFLGAGASRGSKNSKGEEPPDGKKLASLISDQFLGGKHRDAPLSFVAGLAVSESSIPVFQQFIYDLFIDFQPAKLHKLVSTFRWTAIATTNYDLVIERAYDLNKNRAQNVVPLIKNGDRVDQKIRSSNSIMLIKLHGCITNATDENIPLIMSVDQYVTHRKGRDRLFDHLKNFGYEHPILFVGYDLQDPDIRSIMSELGNSEIRPMFYAVSPNVSDEENRFWNKRRITTIKASFEDFMNELDVKIPSPFRGISSESEYSQLPISRKFAVSNPSLELTTVEFLSNDVEFVISSMVTEKVDPKLFYRGYSSGWSAIIQNLDVRRSIVDTILVDVILSEANINKPQCGLYVIKGHAGSGKSVLLRRIAFEATTNFDILCLFKLPQGRISYEALLEIYRITKEPIFFFIDTVSESVNELVNVIKKCRSSEINITFIVSERYNEWNMTCEGLNPYVSDEYEIGYLSSSETDKLLELLEKHNSLGTLEQLTWEQRQETFQKKAGRQLLVALHEATLGKPFEDIIADEYEEVRPNRAQSMYLGICVLNQFDVPVRAGIISRVFDISFSEFKESFFKPLAWVVFANKDPRLNDIVYTTRHPHIAEIIFERILSNPERRLDLCIRLLKALNIDYSSDRTAYRRMIRGKKLLEIFPDHTMINAIYEAALEIAEDDPHFYHQRAIYEMSRPNGNLEKATEYLLKANSLSRTDRNIIHSMAELELRKAELATNKLEFETRIKQAEKLARQQIQKSDPESYPWHTLAKAGLMTLKYLIQQKDNQFSDIEFDRAITQTEEVLEESLQRFPEAQYLLEAESQFSEIISDDLRALKALRKAFEANMRNSYIALRLAKSLVSTNKDEAIKIYLAAIEANPSSKSLRFNYAMLLLSSGDKDGNNIEYHLRRAFTEGDRNYYAQFWYARQQYVNGHIQDSIETFRKLSTYPVNPDAKKEVKGVIKEDGVTKRFSGRIAKLEASYALISRDLTGDLIFLHMLNAPENIWNKLKVNSRMTFSIGFTFRGTVAGNPKLE